MPGTQDDLGLLTGPRAADLLPVALTEHETVVGWRVRSVDHRPGRGTTVSYDVRVRSAAGERLQVVVASTGGTLPADVRRHVVGDHDVAVWAFPDDPALPGLRTATDAAQVAALLTARGLELGPVELHVRAYRPGRRAVVEVHGVEGRAYLKVLRPRVAAALHDRHVLLATAGVPVARSLGHDDGLLLLDGLPGTTLRARLRAGGAVPEARQVQELLDLLPPQTCGLPRRRSWSDEVDHYAGVVAAALPEEGDRCRRIAETVRDRTGGPAADEPVHGDLYETQLLLDGAGGITGLLDVDTAGPGCRADDLACLLGHLLVLADLEPAHRASTVAVAERYRAEFEVRLDPADLRARVAGVVLSLATGPYRVQSRQWQDVTRARLHLAEAWLDPTGGSTSRR